MFPVSASGSLIIKACVALSVIAIIWVLKSGLDAERAAHAKTKAQHALVLQDLAEKTAAAERAARRVGEVYAAESAANRETFDKEKAHALAEKDRVIADLRAGRVQLRQWWRPEVPACPGDSAQPATAAGGDAEVAELRAASTGRIVGAGAEADAWIGWLQRELTATRAVCGATP